MRISFRTSSYLQNKHIISCNCFKVEDLGIYMATYSGLSSFSSSKNFWNTPRFSHSHIHHPGQSSKYLTKNLLVGKNTCPAKSGTPIQTLTLDRTSKIALSFNHSTKVLRKDKKVTRRPSGH